MTGMMGNGSTGLQLIIKYHPRKANSKADILSRWAGHERGEKDNQGVILLGDHLFVRLHDVYDYMMMTKL